MGPKSFSKIGVLGSRSFFTMGGRSRQTSGIAGTHRRALDLGGQFLPLACRARPFVPALSRPDPELVIVTLHEVSEVFDTAATARLALYLLGFWG